MISIEPTWADPAQEHHRYRNQLPMWTVYNSPTDQPGKFVGRMFLMLPDAVATELCITGDSLDELRQALPKGLMCLTRCKEDEPQIVEVWL